MISPSIYYVLDSEFKNGPSVWNALMSKTIIDALAAHSASKSCGISQLILKLQMSTDDNPIWLWSHSIIVSHIYPYKRVQKKNSRKNFQPNCFRQWLSTAHINADRSLNCTHVVPTLWETLERSEIAVVIYFFS